MIPIVFIGVPCGVDAAETGWVWFLTGTNGAAAVHPQVGSATPTMSRTRMMERPDFIVSVEDTLKYYTELPYGCFGSWNYIQ